MHANSAWIAAALAVAVLVGPTEPAGAEFRICNRTATQVSAAFGYRAEGQWISEGWWNIAPDECATVHEPPLNQPKYYVYAWAGDGIWLGDYSFCTARETFTVVGDKDCEARGYIALGFFEVDVGNATNWKTDLVN
jgi:uncharacterized membrane protein